MIARFAALAATLAAALPLGLPAGAARAQNGFGSAASVAAAVGATASPPIAGGTGYMPVPAGRHVGEDQVHEDAVSTGSITQAPRSVVRKPRR